MHRSASARARTSRRRIRALAVLSGAAVVAGLLTPATATAVPVVTAADSPPSVTLAGSFQSELGCPEDWQPQCASTDLQAAGDGTWSASFALPSGSYEFKYAINHSWDEAYGANGGGGNIPVVIQGDTALTFTYDEETHLGTITPTAAQPGLNYNDRKMASDSLREDLTRERFYFVMTDRFANGDPTNDKGGYTADPGTEERLATGYDPTDKGFYHGGDLKGLTDKLDYIKGMGTTAVWLTPSFKNKPVQGEGVNVSAGYHGYWITDFTQIDPHLGTNDELKTLIDKAHAKGMKVFFDIITNHTADVISTPSEYISKETTPYKDAAGNEFNDLDYAAGDTFPELDPATSFPYVPTFPTAADETVKVPAWLNDPTYYHNRGNASFDGTEGDIYGDFVGLDDLFTENPTVRDGLIDVYKFWAEFGIDGFRIDTVKHVNTEFWQKFAPETRAAAAAAGKPQFFEFGEVYDADPAKMSYYTTTGGLQATLDFGFQSRAVGFGTGRATSELAELYAGDDWYTDADSNAYQLPTFLGNHDMGRVGYFLSSAGSSGDELLQRDLLTQQLMYLTRGQPVTYYGDEQGFVGDGGDKDARQDMFASQVASYNDDDLIGTDSTTAVDNYGTTNPVYQALAKLSKLRDAHPTLADGAQIPRYSSNSAGIFAVSRIDATKKVEYVVAINNATEAKTATFDVFNASGTYQGLWGGAKTARSTADKRLTVTVPPLTAMVWKATSALAKQSKAPTPVFTAAPGSTVGGRAAVSVAVPQGGFNQVTFAWRPAGTTAWKVLGTDDNAPYRVFHDVSGLAKGTVVEYRAILKDSSNNLSLARTSAVVGDPAPTATPGGAQNDPPETQPDTVTVAGDLDSEIGCPGDWQPDCEAAMMTFDANDGIWKATFDLPPGNYAYKVALNGSWTENYGAGAVRDGGNIPLTVGEDPVTFYYDPASHWITSDAQGPIITVAGSHQSELGCAGDWSPDCMRPWLQDPDGDGTYTFSTALIPPGSYEAKVAHGLSWDENYGLGGAAGGANIPFTVPPGAVTTFSYVLDTHVLTVTAAASTAADLSQSKAQWLNRNWIAWDLPDTANQWHYRLHYSSKGGLGLDATAVTGGSSIALTRSATGLPAALQGKHPNLAGYDALQLPSSAVRDKKLLAAILKGQVVVAAYDDAGKLMDATGVQLPWVLDDLYSGATKQALGIVWQGSIPIFKLWAPTAQKVQLVVGPPGSTREITLPMVQDDKGTWWGAADPRWKGGTYRYKVTVYVPSTGKVETNLVTDPYSVALTTNSAKSVIANLSDASLKPAGWDKLAKPALPQPVDSSIYELHVRDFSISDTTVPAAHRGTYLAFTDTGSAGMQHLKALADAGMNTLHLLPVFDIATIEEDRSKQQTPACDLPALTAADPAGEEQQACTSAVAATDGFNWGYDPYHYTTPEGSYSTNPSGTTRTKEFRQMVAGINGAGMRVVMDVVYNHTAASGQDPKSVLDRIVPGYYQRLSATGAVENSTCCSNTAPEHAMMGKLVVDSVVTWAKQYKVDGFRFDLMGHHPKANLLAVRAALDKLTVAKDGVDGKKIYVYGEGWNFGEVADNALFEQATQANMAGTGIGTFNDRLRDSVRGGGPFDENPGKQGFGSGLYTDPNTGGDKGSADEQLATLLLDQDRIKVGLVGNLAGYTFTDATGATVTGADIDYNGAPTGYTAQPSETINYVDAHDNETLFDALTYKLPVGTAMADKVRMNTLSLSTVALSQGPMFWHAGADLLRSKSLDRDSYNSGDWFNRIDWTGTESTFGSGLPPEAANSAKWPYMTPLLADPANKPAAADIQAAGAGALDVLELRYSSPLFRLGSASLIQQKVSFLTSGPDQTPGVIAMQIDDRVGADVDPALQRVVVVFNASPDAQSVAVDGAAGLSLSPIQAGGSDPVVKGATVGADAVTVPGRTVAVFVQS
ncbi:pullulanase-type alpha-1,6-glucosidase [Nakamurella sp. YIM 132087]|uniref:Pullulanase-type alpha-1,6-glucosidase n=1 Tax=Nakamurella alba TaxID=2665158 RepID=A0A7K1FSS8_9ACTN|nr:pullulanase-type alpha-1,6-glucosidase [Nakamurella alba]MTD16233.1 pullulanase-type alpha-1,6-glucosidase [Nakamurella alba]